MKRQRRYKVCDPFAVNKKNASKEEKFDLPPRKADEDYFGESKSFLKLQRGINKAMSGGKVEKQKKKDMKNVIRTSRVSKKKSKQVGLEKQPNESKKQYFQRLDQNVNDAINTTMIESKT